jgi:hypothetical protein
MHYIDSLDQMLVGILVLCCLWALGKLAAVVAAGVVIRRKVRDAPAGGAAVVALLATPLLIAQWMFAGGSQLPGPGGWFGSDGGFLSSFTIVDAAAWLAVLLYPFTWGCLVLWRRVRQGRAPLGPELIVACLLAGATICPGIPVARFEFNLTLAHHFADPQAFHRLANTCAAENVLCQRVPAQLWSPNQAGILVWIAGDSTAPPDVVYALARSGDRLLLRTAAGNPRLPAQAFRDTAFVGHFETALYMVTNPGIPAEALDSLIVRYRNLRGNLMRDRDYMCKRAAPSTMWILGTDGNYQTRAAAARSPRAPDDLLDTLVSDPSPPVRKAAQSTLQQRERARQGPSADGTSCVYSPNI